MSNTWESEKSNSELKIEIQSKREIRLMLEEILNHRLFHSSYRLKRLLRYLVEYKLSGEVGSLKELAIGLDVFDLDPATFNPSAASVVRVTMGRLREKLDLYNQLENGRSNIGMSIPVGSYTPTFFEKTSIKRQVISFQPFFYLRDDIFGRKQLCNINAKLCDYLQAHYGDRYIQVGNSSDYDTPSGFVLEGSGEILASDLMIKMRIIDPAADAIVVSTIISTPLDLAADQTDHLVREICHHLQAYLRPS